MDLVFSPWGKELINFYTAFKNIPREARFFSSIAVAMFHYLKLKSGTIKEDYSNNRLKSYLADNNDSGVISEIFERTVFSVVDEESLLSIRAITSKKGIDFYKSYILNFILRDMEKYERGYFEEPIGVVTLCHKLLNVQKDDNVANFGCASLNVIRDMNNLEPQASYTGYDYDQTMCDISRIRAFVLGSHIAVEKLDLLCEKIPAPCEKIIFFPPFNINNKFKGKDDFLAIHGDFLRSLNGFEDKFCDFQTWCYLFSALCNLNTNGGKAVIVFPSGSGNEKEMRKFLIENGLVEGVVEMPHYIFPFTNISTVIYLLSFGNETVSMTDITTLCTDERRINTITEENCSVILETMQSENKFHITVTKENVEKHDWLLLPSAYLSEPKYNCKTVQLGDISKRIIRGVPVKAAGIDEMITAEDTGIKYVMLKNINDGLIDEDVPFVKLLNKRMNKFIVDGNKTILISKSGISFKSAIIQCDEKTKYLVSYALLFIEVDDSKINPIYLQAFLESEKGKSAIKSCSAGTKLLVLNMDSFKSMKIPLLPREEQDKIAKLYKEHLEKVMEIRRLSKENEEELLAITRTFDEL